MSVFTKEMNPLELMKPAGGFVCSPRPEKAGGAQAFGAASVPEMNRNLQAVRNGTEGNGCGRRPVLPALSETCLR